MILKEIEVGDEIDVVTSDGKVYTCIVEKTEILDTDTAMRIPTIEGRHMILMTCYPFYYTGHASQKFVVTCSLKENEQSPPSYHAWRRLFIVCSREGNLFS